MTSQAVYCLSLQIRPPSDENNDGLITNQKDTSMSNKTTNLDNNKLLSASSSSSGIDIEVKNSSTSTYKLNNRNKSIQILQQKQHQHHHTSTSIGTSTTSSLSASSSLTKTLNLHHQQQQQQQQHHHQQQLNQQQQQHSNIILVRGARTENGQIILQNSHELLSLLNGTATIQQNNNNDNNDDNNKSIILQHQRIKTTTTSSSTQSPSSSGLTKIQCNDNIIGSNGNNGGTVLLQSTTNFKKNLLSDGSIILQQRLNKSTSSSGSSINNNDIVQHQQQNTGTNTSSSLVNSGSNSIGVNSGGPFLLQTLKRLDKSQSILVFRNPNSNAATVLSSASIGTSTTSGNNNNIICGGGGGGQSQSSSSIANLSGATTLTLTTTSNPIISGLTKNSTINNKNNSSTSSSIALTTTTGFSQRITTTKSANININNNNNNKNNNNQNNNNNNISGVSNSRNQNGGNSVNIIGNRGNCNRLDDVQDKSETRSQQKQMNVPLGTRYHRPLPPPPPPPNSNPTIAHQSSRSSTMYHHPSSLSGAVGGGGGGGLMYPPQHNSVLHGLGNLHSGGGNSNSNNLLHQQQHSNQLNHNSHHHMMAAAAAAAAANRQHQHSIHQQQHHHHHHHLANVVGHHHSVVSRQIFNHMQTSIMPLNANGEPIKLPDNLESLPRADHFPTQRHRWNTNEEIAAILISFDKHSEWQSKEVRTRPKSGSLLLYSRKKVRYRRDGYCWKKRKDGKTTREDHMKLKVQGTECIYGCYVHSAILPTFHRRCYWLLQNPDIVLVHYLNVPYPDDNKMAIITPSLSLWGDKKEWTKEELVSQLKPMFFSEDDPDSGNDIEISTAETVEAIVSQLMEKQRLARQAALVKQLECGCPDSTCADGKSCAHPMRRIGGPSGGNTKQDKQRQAENNNQVTSTTPNVLVGPRFYSRWVDRRNRGNETDLKSSQLDNSTIQFQVIPSLHGGHTNSISNHHHQQQQQQQHHQHQQHILSRQHNSNQLQQLSTNNNNNSSTSTNNTLRLTNQPQQQQQQQQSSFTNASNQGNQINRITNNNISQIIINTNSNTNHNNGNSSSTAIFSNCISDGGGGNLHNNSSTSTTTIITTNNNNNNSNNNSSISSNNQLPSHSNTHQQHHHHQQQQQKISLQNSSDNNLTNDGGNNNHHHLHQNHLTMTTSGGNGGHPTSVNSSASNTSSTSSTIVHHHHHQQQQQQQQQQHIHSQHHQQQSQQQQPQSIIDSNIVNQRLSSNLISNSSLGRSIGVSCTTTNNSVVNSAPPLVLNLSQISGSGNSLLILNGGQQQSFVCQTSTSQQQHQRNNSNIQNLIPKMEKIETKPQQHHFTESVFDDITFGTTSSSTATEHPLSGDKHQQNNLVKELNDSLPFFNETLDLSQEDIQKTLIANMPSAHTVVGSNGNCGGNRGDDDIDSDINPMDFIDNVCDVDGVVGGTNNDLVIGDSNGCVGLINDVHDPDDVFVNLDAFDMFVEFPELDLDGKTNFETNIPDGGIKVSEPQQQQQSTSVASETTGTTSNTNCNNNQIGYNITDYSPEWAYPEGGVKVLVTGPWNSTSSYTVLFDAFPVKTTIVQDGVLRCFCPAHEVGLATLQVACDGIIVSNSVIFEYKSPPNIETAFEGAASESLYKFTLLNRLSSIDEKMQIKTEPKEIPEESTLISQSNFEERLVNYCQHLTNKVWRPISPRSWPLSYKGMTLLHLASALGYTKLVCAMLTWRSDNPNLILETEIDALSQDIIGFTPLAWACAGGHCETAIILYKWNHNSLNIENNFQQSPLDIAKQNGYTQLIGELKRLEKLRISCQSKNQSSSLALNTFTKETTPNNNNNHNTNNNNSNSNNNKNLINNSKNINNKNNNNNNNSNLTRTYDESSSNNSSPIDDNSNSSSNGSNAATITNCGGNNNNDEICNKNNNDTLNGSNRSHDGVFLRPGAVSSQSPPSARISKRSSVDSGINMDIRSYSRSGKMFKDHNRFQSGLDSNDSFSLSMDSNFLDSGIGMSSGSNGTLLSPMRKMDFALCEISASDTSCSVQDKQPGCSLSDDEDITDQNLKNDSGGVCVGESDAKVLTLAEHIIAAMPDRIKNESEDIMSLGSPMSESLNTDGINDAFMEPLLDSLPSSQFDHELNFEFSDNSYRYHDVSTPCSSLSPASSGPLQSPASYSILQEPTMNSPSPPPSAKELTEFLHASNMSSQQRPFEADFSKLTLTDREQRELYEAAKCIQKAYRSYKGRKKLEEQDKERSAAIVIQNYYRRYKQFAYYKQMTHAALVIQNGYRSYCANKRFKKSQNHSITPTKGTVQDSQCLQNYYKNYQNDQQQQLQNQMTGGTTSKEPSPSGPLKRTYSQRTQNQAARKIQQFMRQSKMKLQRERAEKERLVHQRREEYLQNLQFLGQPGIVIQEQKYI